MVYRRLLVLSLLLGSPAFLPAQIPVKTVAKKTAHSLFIPRSRHSPSAKKPHKLLNRFTFGPRPGDVDAVMKAGVQNWFEQQLNPSSIPDPVLEKRIQDYPALALTPALTVSNFPDQPDTAPDFRRQTAHAERPDHA